jgi:hypothetical protein
VRAGLRVLAAAVLCVAAVAAARTSSGPLGNLFAEYQDSPPWVYLALGLPWLAGAALALWAAWRLLRGVGGDAMERWAALLGTAVATTLLGLAGAAATNPQSGALVHDELLWQGLGTAVYAGFAAGLVLGVAGLAGLLAGWLRGAAR